MGGMGWGNGKGEPDVSICQSREQVDGVLRSGS